MDESSLPLPVVRCLSKEEAARYLGIGLTLLAELNIPHLKFGRRCVYDVLDLDAWLDEYKNREQRRAGKETLWPEIKTQLRDSTDARIPATGGYQQRSQMASTYAEALRPRIAKMPKPI
jgi:hypothetical protein